MLAVISQDLRAEMENGVLLFESVKQMAAYLKHEYGLTTKEWQQIEKDKFAILHTREDGTYYLVSEDTVNPPRGSVSFASVYCNDQREWEIY